MSPVSHSSAWQRAIVVLAATILGVVVVAVLYWAQLVIIPVALAAYLTFLLTPLVLWLQRRGLNRTLSVLSVCILAGALLAGVSWMVTRQVSNLVSELPRHAGNIKGKAKALRESFQPADGGQLNQLTEDVKEEMGLEKPNKSRGGTGFKFEEPTKVVVEPESPGWVGQLSGVLNRVAEPLATLALALVLTVFMLFKREDLRNRVIRLLGQERMTTTTKAIDDAARRISRFMVTQLLLNATFGLAVAVGLALIGVPYFFLWGFIMTLLRYIPYLGSWVALVLPLALSLAIFDRWLEPLLVMVLIISLELVFANVLEPWLFGHSVGVSEVGLLVAAAFWAFLWGWVGLLLATPLTVCLVVMGKYVKQLEFFDVLLGDQPALSDEVRYYQRLLAGDQDEATDIVDDYMGRGNPEGVYDAILVPALVSMTRDRADLSEQDQRSILETTREVLDDLGPVVKAGEEALDGKNTEAPPVRARILCCAARDEADQVALEMFRQVLDPARWEVEATAVATLASELMSQIAETDPAVVCIAALPPGGLSHTRYLCKRIRRRYPDVKIVVGRWGLPAEELEHNTKQLTTSGADAVLTNLLDTRRHVEAWFPVFFQEEAQEVAMAKH